ncbi:MAG: substrate-binding periplasmic protein [Desulfovibrio sp.]
MALLERIGLLGRVLLLCGVLLAVPARAENITLLTGEWLPYTSKDAPFYGITSQIVTEAYKTVGIDLELEFFPWKRCRYMVESGEALGTFPWYMTVERAEFALFSVPVTPSTEVFFYLKKNIATPPVIKNIDDLKEYRIGGLNSSWLKEVLDARGVRGEYSDGHESLFMKFFAERFDLLQHNEIVGWRLISKLYPDRVEEIGATPNPFSPGDLRVMFSKKYPRSIHYLHKLNQGLGNIKASGLYDKLLDKALASARRPK